MMDDKFVKYVWMTLNKTIQKLQTERSDFTHEELYQKAFERVTNKHGFRMYDGLRDLLTEHLQKKVRQEILESLDTNFLAKLNKAWIEHQALMLMLSDILGYMDHTYIKQRGMDSIYNLGMKAFRYEVVNFAEIKSALNEKLSDMINKDRLGDQIMHSEIQTACAMLMELGINSRYFYEQTFEINFLAQTAEYYETKSQELLEQNKEDYDTEMKALILKESTGATKYFDQQTVAKIVQVIEAIKEKNKISQGMETN